MQLARALAEKHGRRLDRRRGLAAAAAFTQGNPLTITVLVGQALRDGLKTKEQIEAFVARLRAGEAAFDDEAGEGRSRSLGASLSYGFEHAFTEEERKKLALLHLFQGFVDVDVLRGWAIPRRVVPARGARPDPRGGHRPARPRRRGRAADRPRRRLLRHPPGAALVLQGPVRAVLPGRRPRGRARVRRGDGRAGELLPRSVRAWEPRCHRRAAGRRGEPAPRPPAGAGARLVAAGHQRDARSQIALRPHRPAGGVAAAGRGDRAGFCRSRE